MLLPYQHLSPGSFSPSHRTRPGTAAGKQAPGSPLVAMGRHSWYKAISTTGSQTCPGGSTGEREEHHPQGSGCWSLWSRASATASNGKKQREGGRLPRNAMLPKRLTVRRLTLGTTPHPHPHPLSSSLSDATQLVCLAGTLFPHLWRRPKDQKNCAFRALSKWAPGWGCEDPQRAPQLPQPTAHSQYSSRLLSSSRPSYPRPDESA